MDPISTQKYLMETIFSALSSYLLPFFRIGAFLMVMPGIGTRSVPARIRVFLAVAMTVAMTPMLKQPEFIDVFSVTGFLLTLQQVVIGVSVGFILLTFIHIFNFAGFLISMQSSLGFAAVVDPSHGQQVPVVAHYYQLFSLLIFFLMDGHLAVFKIIFFSFDSLPIAMQSYELLDFKLVASWTSWIFKGGLALALSSLIALMLINFAFGVMTRASPQLNIFTIGFPIIMLCGLLILWFTITQIFYNYPFLWKQFYEVTCDFVGHPC
jgi:flagellar biosynthetic protein FliR